MPDYTETIRHIERELGADWTQADKIQHAEFQAHLDCEPRKTAQAHSRAREAAHARIVEWCTTENPVLQFLPAGLTAEQCKVLAHLVTSRRVSGLALALLVAAKKGGTLLRCQKCGGDRDADTSDAMKVEDTLCASCDAEERDR